MSYKKKRKFSKNHILVIFLFSVFVAFTLSSCTLYDKKITDNLYLDKSTGTVYFTDLLKNIKILEGVDSNTFEKVDSNDKYEGFYKDKNSLYQIYEQSGEAFQRKIGYCIIEGIDTNTFVNLGNYYIRDDKNLYYKNISFVGVKPIEDFVKVEGVDVNSLEILNNYFFKDKNNVFYMYYINKSNIITTINGADSETFKLIDATNSEDKNNIYIYNDKNGVSKIEKQKSSSGEIVNNNIKILGNGYRIINNRLFKYDKTIILDIGNEIIDVDSLEYKEHYFKDKNNIYFIKYDKTIRLDKLLRLDSIDINTFTDLGKGLIKDKDNIYSRGPGRFINITDNIDVKTFKIINEDFSKDKKNVYWDCREGTYEDDIYYHFCVINNLDPNTFQILNNRFVKDKNNLYYIYGGGYLENFKYKIGIASGIDLDSIKVINYNSFKDKNNTYIIEKGKLVIKN